MAARGARRQRREQKLSASTASVTLSFLHSRCLSCVLSGPVENLGGTRNSARADLGGGEAIRMMQRDMPCPFPNPRESAQDYALVVDVEALLHRGDRLEDVPFAGPTPAGAIDAPEAGRAGSVPDPRRADYPYSIRCGLGRESIAASLIRDGRITRTPAVEMTADEFGLDPGV